MRKIREPKPNKTEIWGQWNINNYEEKKNKQKQPHVSRTQMLMSIILVAEKNQIHRETCENNVE